jgi:hypothetical protein
MIFQSSMGLRNQGVMILTYTSQRNSHPSTNDNDSYWLWHLIYLFMIISIEFYSNSFNATCDFNTKAHSSKRKVFMNWNVQDE